MATPERRYGPGAGITLGGIIVIVGILILLFWSVILGIIVGEFVRGLILASAGGVSGVPTVAKLAKGAVITIALFMALQQVGVAEEIVTAAFTLILGAAALAVGLARALERDRKTRFIFAFGRQF